MFIYKLTVLRIVAFTLFTFLFVAMATAEPSFTELEKTIRQKQPTSVEELFQGLDRSWFDTVAMVYDSRNQRQDASLKQPRFVIGNSDASLLMAVTFNEQVRGGQLLEVIHFDHETAAYRFKSIEFSEKGAAIDHNPQSCARCHAGLPIWDPYPTWPGMVGSVHETRSNMARNKESQTLRAVRKEFAKPDSRVAQIFRNKFRITWHYGNADLQTMTDNINLLTARVLAKDIVEHARFAEFRESIQTIVAGNVYSPAASPFHMRHEEEYATYEAQMRQQCEKANEDLYARTATYGPLKLKIGSRESTFEYPPVFFGFLLHKMGIDISKYSAYKPSRQVESSERDAPVFGMPNETFHSFYEPIRRAMGLNACHQLEGAIQK